MKERFLISAPVAFGVKRGPQAIFILSYFGKRQVVILAVGHSWIAEYEITAHVAAARSAGVPQVAVDAILQGDEPVNLGAAALTAYRLTVSLLRDRAVADDLYRQAIAAFGEGGVIAILCLVAQYQLVSSVLNCFEVPSP